jgi:hypothetical protein
MLACLCTAAEVVVRCGAAAGVLKRASPAPKAAMPSADGDDDVTWVRQRQRLQQQRAKRAPRRRNWCTKPKPVPVFLLPPKQRPPPPQPPAAKTPAFLRLLAGAGHTPLGAEAAPEMDRRPASMVTPTEGVMERWERPPSGARLRGGRARGGGDGSHDAGAGTDGTPAGTPALLPARNCAPTPPPLPPLGTTVTTRSRSSRSSSGSPVDNLVMQPFRKASPSSAAGSAVRSGSGAAAAGRSRFSIGGDSNAAVARESAVLSGGGGGSHDAETFSFGVEPAGGSGSPKSGGSPSHEGAQLPSASRCGMHALGFMLASSGHLTTQTSWTDCFVLTAGVVRADSAAAESPAEPVLRTRWDTVSKATASKSSLRIGAASRRSRLASRHSCVHMIGKPLLLCAGMPVHFPTAGAVIPHVKSQAAVSWQLCPSCVCMLCSIGVSVQQLRFSTGEQPALEPGHQQQRDAAQPGAGPAGEGGESIVDTAVPQPLSPAEPLAIDEAEQPDMPAAAAAYSSDDDGGGYDGGDWGGDSDVEAAPADDGAGEFHVC